MARVTWESEILRVRGIPRFWIDQALGPVFDVLLRPGVDPARVTEVVRLLRLGAFHVYAQGDATSLLFLAANSKWDQEARSSVVAPEVESWRRFLIGDSRPMQQTAQEIRLVAPRRSTVLITGETGTGKELVARSIHAASGRNRSSLVSVNCSALPKALLEAELFGHVKGAFTGAIGHRIGLFEEANHGTIFLDEIGDMPFGLQAKLLRVVQERDSRIRTTSAFPTSLGSAQTNSANGGFLAYAMAPLSPRSR